MEEMCCWAAGISTSGMPDMNAATAVIAPTLRHVRRGTARVTSTRTMSVRAPKNTRPNATWVGAKARNPTEMNRKARAPRRGDAKEVRQPRAQRRVGDAHKAFSIRRADGVASDTFTPSWRNKAALFSIPPNP
ncbi:hypothetical protein GCM10025876_15670 [Demequina litorisediminis]|uniref:Uncharacterized protein n=1 Tax=Demequina litorisediminis TaxID=1849022 RepID=A0ABQ6IC04_9MICO|nr:hypothetical protein GCM10025876_15670 [Demequina litorisediminis]